MRDKLIRNKAQLKAPTYKKKVKTMKTVDVSR